MPLFSIEKLRASQNIITVYMSKRTNYTAVKA